MGAAGRDRRARPQTGLRAGPTIVGGTHVPGPGQGF